jgi:predicted protein tyrosine phosphatase
MIPHIWNHIPSRRTPLLLMRYFATHGKPPPDLDFITDSLAVGGALTSDRLIQALPSLGITAVVDMRSESRDNVAELERLGIHFLHVPTRDRRPPSQEDMETASNWILHEIETVKDGRVLVHCQHGMGRSVIMAAAVLLKMGHDWREALRLIKSKRRGVSPLYHQVAALAEFAENRAKQKSP